MCTTPVSQRPVCGLSSLSPDSGGCGSPAVRLRPCVRPFWATAPPEVAPAVHWLPVCLQPATGPRTPGAGNPRPADLRGGCSLGSHAPAPSPTLHGASVLSSPGSHMESPTLLHIGRTAGLGTARVFNPVPPPPVLSDRGCGPAREGCGQLWQQTACPRLGQAALPHWRAWRRNSGRALGPVGTEGRGTTGHACMSHPDLPARPSTLPALPGQAPLGVLVFTFLM